MEWSNWSGNTKCIYQSVYTPTSLYDAQQYLKDVNQQNFSLSVIGSAHSWSPYRCSPNSILGSNKPTAALITTNLSGILNSTNTEVTCLSGTKIGDLLRYLESKDQTLETFPVNSAITVGGAVATCSHGAGFKVGTISELVTQMTYLTPQNPSLKVNNSTTLSALNCNLGLFGLTYSITLKTRPMQYLVKNNLTYSREEFIYNFIDIISQSDRLFAVWDPNTDMVDVSQFQESVDGTSLLNSFLGPERTHPSSPYVEAEYAVVADDLEEALDIVLEWYQERRPALTAGVFLRFVGSDTKPLISPVEDPEGRTAHIYVLVDLDLTSLYHNDLQDLEMTLWDRLKARPHLGKYNISSDPESLIERYGDRAKDFFNILNVINK